MARNRRILVRGFAGGELSPEMFGRPDDAKFQLGASTLRNFLVRPQGPIARRPGTELLGRTRPTSVRTRLLPFVFSDQQSLAIEATAEPTGRTYFRFYDDGVATLYDLPASWKAPSTFDSADISTANDRIDLGVSLPDIATGDPVCWTDDSTGSGIAFTFSDSGGDLLATASSGGVRTVEGSAVYFEAVGGDPGHGLVQRKIYYVKSPSGSTFKLSESPLGPSIAWDATASSGTVTASSMGVFALDPLQPLWAYVYLDTGNYYLELMRDRDDALAGTNPIGLAQGYITSGKWHRAYSVGDLIEFSGGKTYYCVRDTHNTNATHVYDADHNDRDPGGIGDNYWERIYGEQKTVTFTLGSANIAWTAFPYDIGDPVVFSVSGGGALPPELTAGVTYYVIAKSGGQFQVAASRTGEPIVMSTAGTPTCLALAAPYYEVPSFITSSQLAELNFTQSNDIVTLVHRERPAAELRRYGANDWTFEEIEFGATVSPPSYVYASETYPGEGMKIDQIIGTAPSTFQTVSDHELADGESVYVSGLSGSGVTDDFYRITTRTNNQFDLMAVDDGVRITGTPGTGLDGRVRSTPASVDITNTYVVTAVGADGIESEPSDEVEVTNNLFVPGAYTDLTWRTVKGAQRYRIYKKSIGLFGFIGETDGELTFRDDNIGPDLSISPPIRDDGMRRTAAITFNATTDVVSWPAHGLVDGDPVVFRTNNTLPSGISAETTYFVVVESSDAISLVDSAGAAVALVTAGTGQHWGVGGEFPGAVGYFEQRRIFSGSITSPQTIRFTASGTEQDMTYSLPTVDSDRIKVQLASRRRNEIRHVLPLARLLVLGESAEVQLTPVNDDALTPASIGSRPQSYIGASRASPEVVNATAIFVAARGGHVRELGYSDTIAGYVTGDLSIRAAHLFDERDIEQLSYAKAPYPTLWFVSSAGNLLSLTYVPEEQVGAWAQHTVAGGDVESVVSIPEGEEDRTYVVVNDGSRRYVARMGVQAVGAIEDCFNVDLGLTSTTGLTTVYGLDHLNGQTVAYLADGVAGTTTVSGGQATVPAAAKVHIGLPYVSTLRTMPITAQIDALGYGREWNPGNVHVRVYESGGFEVGPTEGNINPARQPASGELASAVVQVRAPGSWADDGRLYLQTDDPLPLMVVGMAIEAVAGG